MTYTAKCFILLLYSFLLCVFYSCSTNDLHIDREDLLQGMNLNLSDSAFNKIKIKRNEALQKELLVKSKEDYVFGTINSNGKVIKVKARLKGDHPDHFEVNRWSFRIIAKNGKILNHEKISVQGVHTRAYLNEWIFHKLLKREDLINLQYEFFPFCVNDTLCGVYAFESHFDTYLLKNAEKEYGPIMKFDETEFWDYTKYSGAANREELLMRNAKILLTNKKWGKKRNNKMLFERAKRMLRDFINGKRDCKDIFDLDQWAKFIAINELMGSDHALRWHNLRFYFNPKTEKIEPIGFDCGSWMPKDKPLFFLDQNVETFHKLMLNNPQYFELVKKELVRITAKEYMSSFFNKHEDEISKMELLLRNEKLEYTFWESSFYQSQQRILTFLDNEVEN